MGTGNCEQWYLFTTKGGLPFCLASLSHLYRYSCGLAMPDATLSILELALPCQP